MGNVNSSKSGSSDENEHKHKGSNPTGVDICKLSEYVSHVKPLLKKTASSSIYWTMDYQGDSKAPKIPVFVKMFFSGQRAIDALAEYRYQNLNQAAKSKEVNKVKNALRVQAENVLNNELNEVEAYKFIQSNLIETNASPNFVECVSSGECYFEDIEKFLTIDKFVFPDNVTDEPEKNRILQRTINNLKFCFQKATFMDFKGSKISDEKKEAQGKLDNDQFTKQKVMVLVTEAVNDFWYHKEWRDNATKEQLQSILFQVCAASYAMRSIGFTHKDLHLGNFFVLRKNPFVLNYHYNKKQYNFKTDVLVKIFDYDRCIIEPLGIYYNKKPKTTKTRDRDESHTFVLCHFFFQSLSSNSPIAAKELKPFFSDLYSGISLQKFLNQPLFVKVTNELIESESHSLCRGLVLGTNFKSYEELLAYYTWRIYVPSMTPHVTIILDNLFVYMKTGQKTTEVSKNSYTCFPGMFFAFSTDYLKYQLEKETLQLQEKLVTLEENLVKLKRKNKNMKILCHMKMLLAAGVTGTALNNYLKDRKREEEITKLLKKKPSSTRRKN